MALDTRPCSKCGQQFPRELLTVKRVVFYEFGKNGRMIKSRTAGWLCPQHRDEDADWIAEPYEQQRKAIKEAT